MFWLYISYGLRRAGCSRNSDKVSALAFDSQLTHHVTNAEWDYIFIQKNPMRFDSSLWPDARQNISFIFVVTIFMTDSIMSTIDKVMVQLFEAGLSPQLTCDKSHGKIICKANIFGPCDSIGAGYTDYFETSIKDALNSIKVNIKYKLSIDSRTFAEDKKMRDVLAKLEVFGL